MVELAIAIAILTIALGATVSTLVASTALSKTDRETTLAIHAAQSALERVKGEAFEDAFASFNADPNDDPPPGGPGTAPGSAFAVPGLNLRAADPDGFVGQIFFPGDGLVLREDLVDAALGMPRDLNNDVVLDANDHAGDYTVLPVRVRVEWTGETGNRQLEFVTTLTNLAP